VYRTRREIIVTLTLAVETSSIAYGVALADGSRLIAECTRTRDAEHPGIGAAVAELLAEEGIGFGDVARLAVDIGPGQLGNVRTGVAYVNGLAYALGIRIAAVDVLTLLARQVGRGTDAPVLCVRHAGGGDVFMGLFLPGGRVSRLFGPMATAVPELAGELPRVVLAGSAQEKVAVLLPDVEVVASGVVAPSVRELVAVAAAQDADLDGVVATPVTERFAADATA
jgi:tRNA threonylcarbamoyl adenosine modification protein YeaZ